MKVLYFLIFACLPIIAHTQIVTTIAGNGTIGYSGDGGAALSASFNQPDGICVDRGGNYYIADWYNHVIRKVSSAGIVTTVAGNGTNGYSGDGGPATNAQLLLSTGGVAVDNSGNLYISDVYRVRKVNTSGIISTVVGSSLASYSGDGGSATNAGLSGINSVKVDATGNIYVADVNRIRKVNSAGIITTIAGNGTGGYSGDGGAATNAQLNVPAAIALDAAGNLYIADDGNNVVRKVSTSGIITTYAGGGSGTGTVIGDGGPATAAALWNPYDLTTDANGNLFIADYSNYRVRIVNNLGIISTVAGDGNAGFSGDGGPATAAEFGWNLGIATDVSGNLYIADAGNSRVRKVKLSTSGIKSYISEKQGISLSPNPAHLLLKVTSPEPIVMIVVTDLTGRIIYSNDEQSFIAHVDISNWPNGLYFLKINNAEPQMFLKD